MEEPSKHKGHQGAKRKNLVQFPGEKGFIILEIFQTEENEMEYTMETKVGDLLKDAEAVKIFEKYAPGVSKNPMIVFVKGMTLKKLLDIQQAKQAGVTEDMMLKVLKEINDKEKSVPAQ